MKIAIDITSEQLIKSALSRYKLKHESPDMLLANVVAELHSNADSATVIRQAVTNSVKEGITKMERQAMAAEKDFQAIGQMSLLGELIPEHKIPASMVTKSAAEVNAWMENRAQIEQQNLEELRAALDKQTSKAARFAKWATATRQVCETLERAGINPREVSYAEAINKAEALHAGRSPDAGTAPKQSVR